MVVRAIIFGGRFRLEDTSPASNMGGRRGQGALEQEQGPAGDGEQLNVEQHVGSALAWEEDQGLVAAARGRGGCCCSRRGISTSKVSTCTVVPA